MAFPFAFLNLGRCGLLLPTTKTLNGLMRVLLLMVSCWTAHAQTTPAPLRLGSAVLSTAIDGQRDWQEVSLPYHWDKHHPGRQGTAVFEMRFDWASAFTQEPQALLLPKAGNAFRVILNGTLVAHEGHLSVHNGADHSQRPYLYVLSPGLLQPSNVLQVEIKADLGRRGGLSSILVGDRQTLTDQYAQLYGWQVNSAWLVVMFSLLVSAMAMALWWTQVDNRASAPQRDPLYAYAMVAELVWTVGVGYALFEQPLVPWPWWGMVSTLATGVWCSAMTLFCLEVAAWRQGPWGRSLQLWLLCLLLSCPVMAYLALGRAIPSALTLWYGLLAVTLLVFGSVFCAKALRAASRPHRLVAMAIVVNVLTGLRDLYVFRIDPQYPQITWLRFSSVLFGMALLYIFISRFKTASGQARELLSTLESRIQLREQQLHDSYAREEHFLREQERSAERSRILQDMHDGVGAHLSSAIRQVEASPHANGDLLDTLRDALDQLKLTIDAMALPAGDINGLLANLRYRLSPRMASLGLQVQWQVSQLPLLERLDPSAMRQLQFILFEVFSNVMQHAQARCMRVSAHADRQGVELRVQDDGCGFEPEQVQKNGLSLMAKRAQSIGVQLRLSSRPGGTEVRLILPFQIP